MNTARTEQLIINSYKMKFQEIFSSLSSKFSNRESFDAIPKSIGDWILFVPPTPLNNFVTLNWKSTNISKKEILKLEESVHYLKLEGKIMEPVECIDDEKMEFQRIFFEADDEGILSFDFPKNLDFEKERKFDCTILIIPGRAEGSGESKIRRLVCDCLDKHLFPIVMNPRGCSDSPVITPRLFTAADSSDITAAVKYITSKRPWTKLMAVGWEYGANMLTKYLAESGDGTPVAAAACIDNPFDLEEATRSSVCHQVYDRSLRDGLINILQSNQNDDPRVPFASIPRSSMEKNSYTSLLLCSYYPSCKEADKVDEGQIFSWCQHLILEWLVSMVHAVQKQNAEGSPRDPKLPMMVETQR